MLVQRTPVPAQTVGQPSERPRRGPHPKTGAPVSWRVLRLSHGWPQSKVIHLLEKAAAGLGVTVPGRESLKTMLSRWENGARTSDFYTYLLCHVFDLPFPGSPAAQVRRWRCANSGVYRRVIGVSPAAPGLVAGTYLQVGAR